MCAWSRISEGYLEVHACLHMCVRVRASVYGKGRGRGGLIRQLAVMFFTHSIEMVFGHHYDWVACAPKEHRQCIDMIDVAVGHQNGLGVRCWDLGSYRSTLVFYINRSCWLN